MVSPTRAASISRLPLHLLLCLLLFSPVFAEDVYKWTDKNGKTVYSNTPRSDFQAPEELPAIGKESLERRIEELKAFTPPTCENHAGVDCAAGPDADGSVVCMDGYREAKISYEQYCAQAKLEAKFYVEFQGEPRLVEHRPGIDDEARKRSALGFFVTLRNLSAVKARGLEISLILPGLRRKIVRIDGVSTIEPFGLADYTQSLGNLPLMLNPRDIGNIELKVQCENCATVLGKVTR